VYPSRFWPVATYVIMGLNAVVFLVMTFVDASSHPALTDFLLRTFTGFGSNPDLLLDFGASYGPYTHRGEYWRLVMPMFLHIGLLHFAMNNYAIYVLGPFLERIYGYGRFAFLYVATGVGSALVSMRMSDSPSAGASGAIFGIAGLMLVAGYMHRASIPHHWGRVFGKGILPVIVLNLGLGLALHRWVDNWAHLGGLASGMALGVLIPPMKRNLATGLSTERPEPALAGITVLVVAIAMVAAFQDYRARITVARLIEQGQRFRAAKRDDWAMLRFLDAAQRSPRDDRPHEQLGLLYLGAQHWTDAIREFSEALRLNYLSDGSQLGLAKSYSESGNLAKAKEYLQAVQDKFPDTAQGQFDLASVYNDLNLQAEAIQRYQNALRLNPNLAEAQNNLAWIFATSEDPKLRNPKAAVDLAQRAVESSHWKEPTFIDTLAEALYANQRVAEAVKTEVRAIQLDPQNPEYADHLARYRKAASSAAGKNTS
jgi:membrane associated rhomboid family serine protease/tetratricopeptide (TPR) repeat protein